MKLHSPVFFLITLLSPLLFDQKIEVAFSDTLEKVQYNQHIDSVLFNKEDGFSISFIVNNISNPLETLIQGKNFKIKAESLVLINGYSQYSWTLDSALIHNKENSSLLSDTKTDYFVTISFNKDSSITYFMNGLPLYTWSSFIQQNAKILSPNKNQFLFDFYHAAIEEIARDGFNIGFNDEDAFCFFNMKDIKTYPHEITFDKAKTLADDYIFTTIKFVDEQKRTLHKDYCVIDDKEYDYSFILPNIQYYQADQSNIKGHAKESAEIIIPYVFMGKEMISNSKTLDRRGILGWNNMSNWLIYQENINGDFTCKVEINNIGMTQKKSYDNPSDCVWRTSLPIVYDPVSKDRWVCRYDWFGWQDDVNKDGIWLGDNANFNNNTGYAENFNRDIYYILSDFNATIIYVRTGSKLKMHCKIYPNHIVYKNCVYNYTCSLDSVYTDKLNLAFSGEDAKVTITSCIINN